MGKIESLSVALTEEQIAALNAAVDAGEYASTSEIVQEAVRDWQTKRELHQQDVELLRRLWDEGLASGPAGPLDMASLRREARERLEGAKQNAR